jgi:glutathione synthase/RimK-type ligase-like ATP-grasp enzyme
MTKPALTKPKILFIFTREAKLTSTRGAGFITRLKKYGNFEFAEAEVMALEDLVFVIDKRKAQVFDWRTKKDPADFDLVYFKAWQSMPRQAAALAIYLRAKAVPFIDDAVEQYGSDDKLTMAMKLWAARIPTARSVVASTKHVSDVAKSGLITYPAVMKSIIGEKGRDNHLVKTPTAVARLAKQYPQIEWILQDFVPNDGDWRVQVYGGETGMVILRKGSGKSHLNNTSAGGQAELIEKKQAPEKILELAVRAAKAMELSVSGVDIIIDKNTGRKAILEVNQGSQIVTGAYIDKNIPGFVEYMRKSTARRYHRKSSQNLPKKVIGRIEVVGLPEFGIADVAAKTDTGAYSGALHAENIRLVEKKSVQELHFRVPHFIDGRTHSGKFVDCVSQNFEAVQVKSSNGQWQDRYKIRTIVRIQGKNYNTQLTLTDRQSQKVPMLLGRKLLRGNFLVNVELSRGEITKA